LAQLRSAGDRLGVPPCVAAVLRRGQEEHHLGNKERVYVARWLHAMQPVDAGDAHALSDHELALWALDVATPGEAAAAPAAQGSDKTFRALVGTLQWARRERAKDPAEYKSGGCQTIIEDTRRADPASVVRCPYAAAHQGQVTECQRACRGQQPLPVTHPLDSIAVAAARLEW
jgi:hypothetical protein